MARRLRVKHEGGITITREEYRRSFGKRLMKLMAERGLSYYQVAEKAGISPSIMYKYCRQYIMPGVDTLAALADVFGMTMDELLGRKIEKEDDEE